MSETHSDSASKKLYMRDIQIMKDRGEKIFFACPWDYNSAQMADEAGADLIGVGGATSTMTLGGRPHGLEATMDGVEMLTRNVAPAVKRAVLNIGMPYGSFQVSNEEAVRNAITLMKAGAQCVKAQVTMPLIDRARAIVDAGIPFQGHVGLLPQYIHKNGGWRYFGRTAEEAAAILDLCLALEDAGACGIEMECVPHAVATEITKRLRVPVFGIGSGSGTDGQILVLTDVLGLQKTLELSFAKRYVDLWDTCVEALGKGRDEVKSGAYPDESYSFDIEAGELARFREQLGRYDQR